MAELIDKWEVVNKLIRLENNYQFYKKKWDADVLYRRIRELEVGIGKTPGIELVRCKDCCFCHYNSSNETYKCSSMNGMYRRVEPNEFCSYGDRREL